MIKFFLFIICSVFFFVQAFGASSTTQTGVAPITSPKKPAIDTLLKPKSLQKMNEDLNTVVNGEWTHEDMDYEYTAGMTARAPIKHVHKTITDYSLYPKMSSAIKKLEYNEKDKTLDMIGEAAGYRVINLIKVNDKYFDEMEYEVIKGDLKGFKVVTRLWEKNGRTQMVMTGHLPGARKMMPKAMALIMVPVSEMILSVASNNMRDHIESEYKKIKEGK